MSWITWMAYCLWTGWQIAMCVNARGRTGGSSCLPLTPRAPSQSFMSTDEYLQKQQPHLHSHCESEASSPAADEPFARTDDDGAFLM